MSSHHHLPPTSLKRNRNHSPNHSHNSSSNPIYQTHPSEINHLLPSDLSGSIYEIQGFESDLCDDQSLRIQTETLSRDRQEGNDSNIGLIPLGETITQSSNHLSNSSTSNQKHVTQDGVWVDRYDSRLLLLSPTSHQSSSFRSPKIVTHQGPISPTGFSDLPSDHEEMFYFDPDERQQIAQQKLRRRRDDEACKRIKMREEEDRLREEEDRLSKIPPLEQIKLMFRTLKALKSSPSPSLLEIRILTNHGNDVRFSSFLKKDGQWKSYWEGMKSGAISVDQSCTQDQVISTVQPTGSNSKSLPGLADYGESSDEEHPESEEDIQAAAFAEQATMPTQAEPSPEKATEEPLGPLPSSPPSVSNNPTATATLQFPHDRSPTTSEPLEEITSIFKADSEDSKIVVDLAERLKRQERAKRWAESRKKTASVT